MALTCPVDLDVVTLRNEIRTMYGRVAAEPDGQFHFHRGPEYAITKLGYDQDELAQLPLNVIASLAGVGNPHAIARIERNAVLLDIGCGAGTDLLLAARRIGANGRAIGVDTTVGMRDPVVSGTQACGLTNVDVRDGDATNLPVEDTVVDVVISNGVLNLVPDKIRAVGEIARVLKPGGRVQIAAIVIGEVLPDNALRDIDLWAG
jgi:arsenite methyltransferase